jgi:hypothetical protein
VHPEFGFYSVTPDRVSAIPRKSTLREHANLAALAVTA